VAKPKRQKSKIRAKNIQKRQNRQGNLGRFLLYRQLLTIYNSMIYWREENKPTGAPQAEHSLLRSASALFLFLILVKASEGVS